MKDLSAVFGMPVSIDETAGLLKSRDAEVTWEDYSRKFSDKMLGLTADPAYQVTDDPYYDFYKAIERNADRETFASRKLRYDSTVILPGTANGEYKKTAGHFHLPIPGKPYSFPELYQVVNGAALFVMQKVDDYRKEGKMRATDILLAEVHAGEAIVIPPDYGHCTVNISDETMVFINLVSVNSNNYYDGVKDSRGMSVYVFKNGDGYRLEKNPRYDFDCEPKVVVPGESDALGIRKGTPVYTEYLKNPDSFAYLNDPEEKSPLFFSLLKGI